MRSSTAPPGADATNLDGMRPDLPALLRGITEKTQLLQRRILRAEGLTMLERDLMLGTLVALHKDLDDLARQQAGHQAV